MTSQVRVEHSTGYAMRIWAGHVTAWGVPQSTAATLDILQPGKTSNGAIQTSSGMKLEQPGMSLSQDIKTQAETLLIAPGIDGLAKLSGAATRDQHAIFYSGGERALYGHAIRYAQITAYRHAIIYGGTIEARLKHQAGWDIKQGDPVAVEHWTRYAMRIGAEHRTRYAQAQPVAVEHQTRYDSAILHKLGHGITYDKAATLAQGHAISYTGAQPVRVAHKNGYAGVYLFAKAHQAGWDIKATNTTRISHIAPWWDDTLGIYVETPDVRVLHKGQSLDVGRVEVGIDEDTTGWTASIEILRYAQYQPITREDALEIWIGDQQWTLIVAQKALKKAFNETEMEVLAQSPVTILSSKAWEGDLAGWQAHEAVESLIGAVEWSLPHWTLPEAAVFYGTNRLDAAQQIVTEAGGIIQSKPDGTLVVRHKYPVKVTELDQATPMHRLSGMENILEAYEIMTEHAIKNRITVTNQYDTGGGRHDYAVTKTGAHTAIIEVFTNRNPAVLDIVTTGDESAVSIGERTITEGHVLTETVEFRVGQATTRHQGRQLLGLKWLYQNLGAVKLQGNQLIAQHDGYSLAEVTYSTNRATWEVLNTNPELTQFIIME